MCRNIGDSNFVNVTLRTLTKIRFVGYLRMSIPIEGPHAFAASALECTPKAPDPAEKVNEPKSLTRICRAVISRVLTRRRTLLFAVRYGSQDYTEFLSCTRRRC
jgi:hypothetical protein